MLCILEEDEQLSEIYYEKKLEYFTITIYSIVKYTMKKYLESRVGRAAVIAL